MAGGEVRIYAGLTPMATSETSVDGEFSPNHSTEIDVFREVPKAGGLLHTSTRLSLIASTRRAVVVVEVATRSRLSRFFRVITNVLSEALTNLNLWLKQTVGMNAGGLPPRPVLLPPRRVPRDLLP